MQDPAALRNSDSEPIVTQRMCADDLPAIVRLFRDVFGREVTEAFVDWKYFRNPMGPIYGQCALYQGDIAASFGNIPLRLQGGGHLATGAQAVDAMVMPVLRRRGVFYELVREADQQMDDAEAILAYVFPSPAAQAGFVRKLGYAFVGSVPRYVRVLEASGPRGVGGSMSLRRQVFAVALSALVAARRRFATRKLPQRSVRKNAPVRIAQVASFDSRFDEFWHAESSQFPIATARDARYLNWRYVANPTASYTILTCERGDDLVGYAVLSRRDVLVDGAVSLTEFFVALNETDAGLALLDASAKLARQWGASQLQCWMLSHHRFYCDLLQASDFTFWPARWAPGLLRYTTPFIVRLHPQRRSVPDPLSLDNWYLTMGDHDYY